MENQDRRKFLKLMGQSVGALTFGGAVSGFQLGCASLDRLVIGNEGEDPSRVLILGGGLSGLTTAYLLKKTQVPFLVMEGSSRIGGRTFSLNDFNSSSQVAEMGGEWIHPTHETLIHLCKELGLELAERNWAPLDFAVVRESKISERKKLSIEFHHLLRDLQQKKMEIFGRGALCLAAFNAQDLPLARQLDQKNAAEYLESLKISNDLLSIMTLSLETHFGAEAQRLSALSVFALSSGAMTAHFPGVEKSLRLSAGAGMLSAALFDRVSGVIPGRYVRLNSQLVEVDKSGEGFELKFQTLEGVKTMFAKNVVCTLPLSVLRQVKGFYKLNFPDPVMKAIGNLQYGGVTKGALSFSERPWMKSQNLTRWWSPNSGYIFTESEPRPDRVLPHTKSVLSFISGGERGASGGLQSIDIANRELGFLKWSQQLGEPSQVYNWAHSKWSLGSSSYWLPGDAATCAGVLAGSGRSWVFAGEHASLLGQGTMNGAIESAMTAARQITQRVKQN
jgi:monoamine oxidase